MLRREVAAILIGQALGDGLIGWVLLQSSLDQSLFSWSPSSFSHWLTVFPASPTFYPSIALIILGAWGVVQSVAAWRYDGKGLPAWLRPSQTSRIAFGAILTVVGLFDFLILGFCVSPGGCGPLPVPFWPLIAPGVFVITTGLICLASARRVSRPRGAGADILS